MYVLIRRLSVFALEGTRHLVTCVFATPLIFNSAALRAIITSLNIFDADNLGLEVRPTMTVLLRPN